MEKKYIANKNYILRKIAGESVLVSVGAGVADFCGIINLNTSAAVLWETMKNAVTKDTLVNALTDTFEIDRATALADVEQVLQMLEEKGMVTSE